MEILTGIALGLSTLVFVGPVFFYLVHNTLSKGTLAGIMVAFGIIFGDIIYVYFCLNGLQNFLNESNHVNIVAITGAILLVVLGIEHIFKKAKDHDDLQNNSKRTFLYIFLKGFFINFINPFVFAVWVGFATYSETKFSLQATPLILGFTLFTIFCTDIIKVVIAKKLTNFITPKRLALFRKATGILMLLFAIRLFWFAI